MPVGAGALSKPERLDSAGIRNMRPGAELDEITLFIEGYLLALAGVLADKFDFVRLVPALHELHGFLRVELEAFERQLFLDYFFHLCFDIAQVFRGKGPVDIEIVVETVVYRGPDGELDLGIHALYGLSENVRRGMVKSAAAFLVVESQYFERAVALERSTQVAYLTVDLRGASGLVKTRSQAFRDVQRCGAGLILALLSAF